MDFAVQPDPRVKMKESKRKRKKDKYLELARELKKTMKPESGGNNICKWCARYSHQRIGKGTWRVRNKRAGGHLPNYSIVKIRIPRRVLET